MRLPVHPVWQQQAYARRVLNAPLWPGRLTPHVPHHGMTRASGYCLGQDAEALIGYGTNMPGQLNVK